MSPRRVAILGASGSGKSWLIQALADTFKASGFSVAQPDAAHSGPLNPVHVASVAQVDWVITEPLVPCPTSDLGLTTLLMGLDLPNTIPAQQYEDSLLRQTLCVAHTPFRIVYGLGKDRLNNALLALGLPNQHSSDGHDRGLAQFNINRGRDVWQCNDCSDPACEHKLFTSLIGRRAL